MFLSKRKPLIDNSEIILLMKSFIDNSEMILPKTFFKKQRNIEKP